MKNVALLKRFSQAKYLVAGVAVLALGIGYTSARTYATKPTQKRSSCSDTCVSIRADGFSQTELSIKVGTFVEFRSADGRTHDLALGGGTEHITSAHTELEQTTSNHPHDHIEGTDSGEFGADEAWKVQFKKAGTYVIHDHLHPELNILVIAYESGTHN